VKGLSARAALRILGERAMETELEGSGRALSQKPEAGRLVPPGTKVTVVLGAG
jgi:beta-lactam-binding protein with PASTA domain